MFLSNKIRRNICRASQIIYIMTKKILSLTLVICIVGLSCAFAVRAAKPTAHPISGYTVVIDAGHGGVDGGVTGIVTGVKESDLNLLIANALKREFENAGINVVMTRTSAAGLYGAMSKGFKMRDMEKRKEIINSSGAEIMISVHLNKFSDSERRGAQAFYKIGDERSKALSESIQAEFNLGGRKYSSLKGDYYVLNESNCTAVLCECGFLSSAADEALLLTESHREKVAKSILTGTLKYLAENP